MIILGHENPDVDSIISAIILNKILTKKGYSSEFIIPDKKINKDTLEILNKYNIDPTIYMKEIPNDKKIILVDHNERSVNGEIICIIDHHKTQKEYNIEHYYNTNVSSTACFIAKQTEELLDKNDLELAVLATMIDTVSFHSTYLTNMDNIDEAALNGLKKYNINNQKLESSYIQIKNPKLEIEKINKIIDKLKQKIIVENLRAFVFIVHDMTLFKTMYYLIEKDNITTKYYEKYEQRGNTIMPEVFEYVNNK